MYGKEKDKKKKRNLREASDIHTYNKLAAF